MITPVERPLAKEERETLMASLANARAESARALFKTAAASAAICGVLAILTLLASDAPSGLIVAFWAGLAFVFTLWIGLPWRKLMRDQQRFLTEAIQTNRAREIRIQATRVVEFEEEEDEGACYAFEHEADSVVFIVGQEFYEDDDFPNTDFSIVEILGARGQAVDVVLLKRGRKLKPERVIPAAIKNRLEIPEHLAVASMSVDDIESSLTVIR